MARAPVCWLYRTDVGTFRIIVRPEDGRFLLQVIDSTGEVETFGSYHRPEAAADDVFMCSTGFSAWDRRRTVDQPTDLSDWEPRYSRSGP